MKITVTSSLTGVEHTREIDITEAQHRAVLRGASLMQRLMGHLPADEREFLISGITPDEWRTLLGPEPQEPTAGMCPVDPLCMGCTCDVIEPCFHCEYCLPQIVAPL